ARRPADHHWLRVAAPDAPLVAVENARAGDRVEGLPARGLRGERQAEVGVPRRILAGAGGVTLGAVLAGDAREADRARRGHPAVGPDREHAFPAAVGPVIAAVHLRRARAVADAAYADGLGQADGRQEGAVRRLDPDGD